MHSKYAVRSTASCVCSCSKCAYKLEISFSNYRSPPPSMSIVLSASPLAPLSFSRILSSPVQYISNVNKRHTHMYEYCALLEHERGQSMPHVQKWLQLNIIYTYIRSIQINFNWNRLTHSILAHYVKYNAYRWSVTSQLKVCLSASISDEQCERGGGERKIERERDSEKQQRIRIQKLIKIEKRQALSNTRRCEHLL